MKISQKKQILPLELRVKKQIPISKKVGSWVKENTDNPYAP
jgi:hypothetical protein